MNPFYNHAGNPEQSTGITFISLIFVLLGLLLTLISAAQTGDKTGEEIKEPAPGYASISLIARIDNDSVVLRWAPSTPGGWIISNRIGYIVEKVIVDKNKPFDASDYQKLNLLPVKPLTLDEWKGVASPENMFSAIAAQALYGKIFIPRALDENNLNVLKNAADELTNRYSFSLFAADNDAITATALGLRWVDRDIKKDETYAYRVYVAETTEEYTFDTAYIVVDVMPFLKYPAPANLQFESGDGSIKLSWEDVEPYGFSGFYVYRSEDGGRNYKKLTNMPLITATPKGAEQEIQPGYIDTLTANYTEYTYRVSGVTPFGELSVPAEIIAYSKDLTPPPAPTINLPRQISGRDVKISWEMNNPPPDLDGFVVSRSNNSLYGYELITKTPLPKSTREYTDDLSGFDEAYYCIGSIDTAGNMAFSYPVLATRIDTIPPLSPKGLAGIINESGVVNLSWNLGYESNIIGYRVLRANDPTHEFSQLTGQIHPDTVYTDSISINTLTRYVYYRIAAVNRRHQHSELSPVLSLRRPDIIPPAEAVFSDLFVTDTSVWLQWHPSPSEDLAKQLLLRRKQEEEKWGVIDSFAPALSSYTDKNVQKNIVYEYTIISVDSSGLSSKPAFGVIARPYDTGKRKPVENFTAEYVQNDNAVTLKWKYTPEIDEKWWYVIYKATGDDNYKEHKAVDSAASSFTDTQVTKATYLYGIVVMTSFGGESKMVTTTITIDR